MFDQLAWKEAAFLNEFFLRVMGNKHTAGELTTFAFGTLPMCRDESVRNVPWSQRLFTISQIMFSPSLHMFMHEAEVRHFFNCSPLNDETIGETKRDPIVMLCGGMISLFWDGVVVEICNVMLPASFYLNLKIFQPSKLRSIAFIHLQNYFVLEILLLESFLQTILLNLKHKSHY